MKTKPVKWTVTPTMRSDLEDDPLGEYTVEPLATRLSRRYFNAEPESAALAKVHAENQAAAKLIESAPALHAACLRLLVAAEGLDSLNDDESRAEAYADELDELSKAKDQAREALGIGEPPTEAARRNGKPSTH